MYVRIKLIKKYCVFIVLLHVREYNAMHTELLGAQRMARIWLNRSFVNVTTDGFHFLAPYSFPPLLESWQISETYAW